MQGTWLIIAQDLGFLTWELGTLYFSFMEKV
jgi:hypothetical protein